MKNLPRTVFHISKQFKTSTQILNQPISLFPFLNSHLMDKQAKKKLSFQSIENQCDLPKLKQYFKAIPDLPRKQFVFFGRSNVGKSTLLNQLVQIPIAITSKRPGKTKQLLFVKLNTNNLSYFVDAPGYGYAEAASKIEINRWGKLIETYLKLSPAEMNILILFDITHGLKFTDSLLLKMLKTYKKPLVIVFTKCDKMNMQNFETGIQIVKQIQKQDQKINFYIHFTSARLSLGIDQLRSHLLFMLLQNSILK